MEGWIAMKGSRITNHVEHHYPVFFPVRSGLFFVLLEVNIISHMLKPRLA